MREHPSVRPSTINKPLGLFISKKLAFLLICQERGENPKSLKAKSMEITNRSQTLTCTHLPVPSSEVLSLVVSIAPHPLHTLA